MTTKDQLEPQRFSSWTKLTRTAAWVYCFVENCHFPVPIHRHGTIQPNEVSFVEIRIIRQAQLEVFNNNNNNNNNNNGLLTVYPPRSFSPVKNYNMKKKKNYDILQK